MKTRDPDKNMRKGSRVDKCVDCGRRNPLPDHQYCQPCLNELLVRMENMRDLVSRGIRFGGKGKRSSCREHHFVQNKRGRKDQTYEPFIYRVARHKKWTA